MTLVSGQASSPSTATLAAGEHAIQVNYKGDGSFSSTTTSFTLTVGKAPLVLVADNQSMNHYDSIPSLTDHYTGFVPGDSAANAGITATVGLGTSATSTSAAGYFAIHPTVSNFNSANYSLGGTQDGTLTVKPKVMDVRVDYGSKTMSILGLKHDLPMVNITAIDVLFSDNVNVSGSMLQLLGVHVPLYSESKFSYSQTTFDAVWTISGPLGADRLTLGVSGETAAPTTGHGPNIGADALSVKFAVLPGDVDGDGAVSAADAVAVKNAMGTINSTWFDGNGDGVVDTNDFTEVRKRIGLRLP